MGLAEALAAEQPFASPAAPPVDARVARSLLSRLTRLGASNWRLLAEALPAVVGASLAIRVQPFKRVAARASQGGGARRIQESELRRMRWAVEAWAQRVPWRALCFERGLALHTMLRRRDVPSVLHYGIVNGPQGIEAHVWVSLDGHTLIGGNEAPRFTCVAEFPGRADLPIG
jgi:hypothetical protein